MEQESITQTALDQMVCSDSGQLLKAAVPYLPPRGQQVISLYSKIMELKNTLSLFAPDRQNVQICAIPSADPMEMLQDLQRFSYGKSAQLLDQIANIAIIAEILKIMNE